MKKTIIIGLDGATFDIINPNIDSLPNIASLMENGVTAPLISTIPYMTAPAWTSMTTGVNPGKHGIFYFTENPHKNYGALRLANNELHLVNNSHVRFKRLWTILSEAQIKSITFRVPLTYPPTEINGIMITNDKEQIITYPPEIAKELIKRFKMPKDFAKIKTLIGSLPIEEFLDRYLNSQLEYIETFQEVMKYLIKEYEWTFFMGVILSPDQMQHFFWKYMDKNHILYNDKYASKYKDAIKKIYQRIDSTIGEILSLLDEETTVIIVSDHGGGPVHRHFYLNNWLEQQGYLTWLRKSHFKFKMVYPTLYKCLDKIKLTSIGNVLPHKLRNLNIPMVKKAVLSSRELTDWDKTKAFVTYWGISINLQGREPKGIVPLVEYEDLIKEITGKLYQIEDPQTGKKIVKKVFRKEELYNGPYVEESTDLIVMLEPLYEIKYGIIFHNELIYQIKDTNITSGNHRQEGIFIMKGPDIKEGVNLTNIPQIMDITPTVLYLMNIPILAQMDGKVIEEAIKPEFLQENPIRISDEQGYIHLKEVQLPPEEEIQMKAQLRALGYLE